jgi:hypothetical protein
MKQVSNLKIHYSKQPQFYAPLDLIKIFKPRSPYLNIPWKVNDLYSGNRCISIEISKTFSCIKKKGFRIIKKSEKKNIKLRYRNECYVNRESYSKNLYKQKIYLKLGFLNSQFFQEIKKKKLLRLFPKFTMKIRQMNWSENRMVLVFIWLSLPEFQLNMKYWIKFILTDRLDYEN